MFYSVDILTRKGKLGLIWLAATYGESKKGMANREFRRVNITRACHDIMSPVVPFALRLSSHLMIGVVRIYREQTKVVWTEVAQMWKTLRNALVLRTSEIDMINPMLREEVITDDLDFTSESFRVDLDVHSVALIGLEGYFVVNGDGHLMPSVSPPLPVGRFSPPSIPGTPMQYGSPVWHPEWRPPSGSDNERSPIEAREGNIKIAEVDHIRMRIDEPIKIPDEIDITGEASLPDIYTSEAPLSRQTPKELEKKSERKERSLQPKDEQSKDQQPREKSTTPPPRSPAHSPPHSPALTEDLLDDEPSATEVLIVNQETGKLVPRLEATEAGLELAPTTILEPDKDLVARGLVTPGVPIETATPSPPRKRRRLVVDRSTQIDQDVIRHNVETGGRETLCARELVEHPLVSAKDLFMAPATEAMMGEPFIDLWRRNAATNPEEYRSSESDVSEWDSLLPSVAESFQVPRDMETPAEKEILRDDPNAEQSGLLERSEASTIGFTPDTDGKVKVGEFPISADQDMEPPEMEPTAPLRRPSSLLRSSMTGLLSPIHEPSDFDEYMEDIGDLPTLMEQSEVTQSLEEQTSDTWRMVNGAMRLSDGQVVFRNLCPPQLTERKSAAKVFYHLLALHKNGIFELKQRDPYQMTNIYIQKGTNY